MQQPYPQYQPPVYAMQPMPKKRRSLSPACGCCMGILVLTLCIMGIPLACIGFFVSGNPDQLYSDFKADPTAAAQYDVLFDNAIKDARNDGSFDVQIEQRDFESWLNVEYRNSLTEGTTSTSSDLPDWVNNIKFQTKFDNGEITLFGTTKFSGISVNMLVVSKVTINTDSTTRPTHPLLVEVTEFKAGAIDMPESFRTQLASDIADGLSEELTQVNQRYELSSLTIDNGVMEFSGHVVR
ncbi:MAG: hypothetical protein HY862_08720 [Chloroflexi bacterium]|nr:hypothetical protein [Chloroflexota bacterium]